MKKHIRNFKDQNNISKHLFCSICHEVYRRPVLIACGHTFCKHCIQLWKVNHKFCPNCRHTIEKRDNLFKNLVPQQIIDELDVVCATEECKWVGKLSELEKHYTQCKYFIKMNQPVVIQEANAIMIEEEVLLDDNSDVEIVEVKNLKVRTLNNKRIVNPISNKIGIQKAIQKPKQNTNSIPSSQLQKQTRRYLESQNKKNSYSNDSDDDNDGFRINEENSSENHNYDNDYDDDEDEQINNNGYSEKEMDNDDNSEGDEPLQKDSRVIKEVRKENKIIFNEGKKIIKKINIINYLDDEKDNQFQVEESGFQNDMKQYNQDLQELMEENTMFEQKEEKSNGHNLENVIQEINNDDNFNMSAEKGMDRHKKNLENTSIDKEESMNKLSPLYMKGNEDKKLNKLSSSSPNEQDQQKNLIMGENASSFNLFQQKNDVLDEQLTKQYSAYLTKFSSILSQSNSDNDRLASSLEKKTIILNEGDVIKSDSKATLRYVSPFKGDYNEEQLKSDENKIIENQDNFLNSEEQNDDKEHSNHLNSNIMEIETILEVQQDSQLKEIQSQIKNINEIKEQPLESQVNSRILQSTILQNDIEDHNENSNQNQIEKEQPKQQQEQQEQEMDNEEDEDEEEESKCNRNHEVQQDVSYQMKHVDINQYKNKDNKYQILNEELLLQNANEKTNPIKSQQIHQEKEEKEQENKEEIEQNVQENNQQKKKNPIIDILFGFWKN